MAPRWAQVGLKTVLTCARFLHRFEDRFLVVFGLRFGALLGPQGDPKIDPSVLGMAATRGLPKTALTRSRPPQELQTTLKTTKNDKYFLNCLGSHARVIHCW